MDINVLVTISCICIIFVLGRIFIVPLKWLLRLIINSILGGVLIFVLNVIGKTWGFHIGLNLYTSILIRNIGLTRCYTFNCNKITYNIKNSVHHNDGRSRMG